MSPHQTLQAWRSVTSASVDTRPTPETEIAALEARYGVRLPEDFRQYLSDGIPETENWDAETGCWWPLHRIRNIPEEYEHQIGQPIARNSTKHLFFLDYCVWCWGWAISCADDETRGKIAVIGSENDGYVADNFTEFVNRYINDWASVIRA